LQSSLKSLATNAHGGRPKDVRIMEVGDGSLKIDRPSGTSIKGKSDPQGGRKMQGKTPKGKKKNPQGVKAGGE